MSACESCIVLHFFRVQDEEAQMINFFSQNLYFKNSQRKRFANEQYLDIREQIVVYLHDKVSVSEETVILCITC